MKRSGETMAESVKDIIERLRAKQLGWWKHLKSEGWHLCAICRKKPVAKEATVCAFCAELQRKGKLPKTYAPDRPAHSGVSEKPQLLPPAKKEGPDDKQ
ncbi:MAG TPA: hypothetical protein PLM07_04085 [Candidatus Rifleibacterium sp.]|nr:hypothetical protein [Candidatus Rifleibacterium sp.]HPT45065.1 hypothetical protein [Candidatus Rifleibacterium sp.]